MHSVAAVPSQKVTRSLLTKYTRTGQEVMYLRHSDKHTWYWISSQTKDEVTAFVVWDSMNRTHPYSKFGFILAVGLICS